ncbi:MAG TPA: hypothetical protein VGK19_03630 [Capsulimonadaceae bacterium]|jgi:hypothetical protein
MKFASGVFRAAGIYGLIVLLPMYFLEHKISTEGLAHPEYFYGFIGVAVAWQVLFLVIATDPAKYRAAIPAALIEKASFVVALAALLAQGRISLQTFLVGSPDLVWFVLFLAVYVRLGRIAGSEAAKR